MEDINKLTIISFIRTFSISIINPYIGLALNQNYKLPIYLVGLYYLGYTLATALGYIFGGYLADFIGRRNAMIISTIMASIFLALSLFNLSLFVAFMFFFNNAYGSANTTAVGDTSDNLKGLVKSFSRVRIGANAGWAIGPAIGGFLYEKYGFNKIILLASIFSIIAVPFLIKIPNIKGSRKILIKPSKKFSKFLIPSTLTSIIMGQLGLPFVLYVSKIFSISTAGYMFTINGLMVVFFQDFFGRKFAKFNYKYSLALGMFIYSISYLNLIFINKIIELALDIVLLTIAEMIVSPINNAVANAMVESGDRGKYMGLFGLTVGIGRTLGQSLSTELSFSKNIEWGNVSFMALLSSILYLVLIEI
ncbi:arabinose efflux permease family protein [Caldisphaera lagunensis DSM 15908]|uniref:Arabinose efflux permease family protein n=1 Tax=Caldisphaera lagunensis (strain DSM 15908 / JCM 11604 / ANMR 0165 / IC-154) TaxID=1056495 RepID=L0AAH6_CALLD|nr:MFS transporter [Caldisphaera lagunensis]AFZ70092.1 arabinose efflux permease family protein [Caldisphaera lagunensis DSM 15908]